MNDMYMAKLNECYRCDKTKWGMDNKICMDCDLQPYNIQAKATESPPPSGHTEFALLDACRELVKLHHEYKDCDSWEGDKFSDMHIKWQDTVSKVIAETEKAESS